MKQKRNNRPEGNPSEGVGGPNTFITPAKRRILSFSMAMAVAFGAMGLWLPGPLAVSAAGMEHVIDVKNVSSNVRVYSNRYIIDNDTNNPISYNPEDTIVFTGTSSCWLDLWDDVTVTLRDLELTPAANFPINISKNHKDTTLVLEGRNTLKGGAAFYPGINVPENTSLVITGAGSLEAHGAAGAAGIGGRSNMGHCGKITIESGEVRAYGGGNAAGIGSGNNSHGDTGGEVIINGGTVYAESENGYAIGARKDGTDAGSLVVNGGSVTLRGGFGPDGTGTYIVNGGNVSVDGKTAPSISNVLPGGGPPSGGTDVTLTGSGFAGVTSVRIDGTDVTNLTVVDDTTITCTTPAGAAGAADVAVLNPTAGADTLTGGFLYGNVAVPVIAVQGGGTEIPQVGSLTLEVTNASAYNAPSYQWFRDGAAVGADDATLVATEAGTYKVAVTAEGQTVESDEITLTAEGAPLPSEKPFVPTARLTITEGDSATFTVSLGAGVDAAYRANISSNKEPVAIATPTSLTLGQSGTVMVKGVSSGSAVVSIGYSGGSRDGEYDEVQVTVTDTPLVPPSTPPSDGSSRSSGASSRGSSAPDGQTVKAQLPASAFTWDGRTLTIDHERITLLDLLSVQWDGTALTRGTEYSVYEGSVIVRFGEDFIAAQAPGSHTVRVEFLSHTGETMVAVGEIAADDGPYDDVWDEGTYNPNTGGGSPTTTWLALLGCIGGLAMAAWSRRKRM